VVDADPDRQSITKEGLIPGLARNTTCQSKDTNTDVQNVFSLFASTVIKIIKPFMRAIDKLVMDQFTTYRDSQ